MRSVQIVVALVSVATVVAAVARRTRIPAPSLLVVVGLAVALVPGVPAVQVSPEVVGLVVLPPLVYAAGEDLAWRDLRRVWRPVAVLAVGLVAVSAAAVGAVAAATVGLPASLAFLLGAVLASTDPVAVSALGRRLALPVRLRALVQAESLFNDATSLVLFRVAASFAVAGGAMTAGHVAADFVRLAGGGILAGAIVAIGVATLRRRTEDPVVETVISLITPYVAYVAAEAIRGSGVTAVVVASVIIGALTPRLSGARTRLQLHAVHGTVVFVLESVVFALIGLALPDLISRLSTANQGWFLPALAIAGTLMAVRILWMLPLAAFRQWRDVGIPRPFWQVPLVVSWAGARGVVPLAAALSIPLTDHNGQPLTDRDLLLVLATAVIAISLVVQGFTLAPLVRRVRLAVPAADAADEYDRARLQVVEVGLSYVDDLEALETVPPMVLDRIRSGLQTRVEMEPPDVSHTYRQVRREVVAAQGRELARLHAQGLIGEGTRRRIQRQLDLEDARFTDVEERNGR